MPEGHNRQSDPYVWTYFPAGQSVHVVDPESEVVPDGQDWQPEYLAIEYVFEEQL